jgi:DNA-binding transcriptional MerR regulator
LERTPRFTFSRVSELADQVGVSADTVRYYEKNALLPEPARSAAGYRQFEEHLADRLRFIKAAQSFGLKLAEIRELLEIHDRVPARAAIPRFSLNDA